jgi:hypothetical protein
MSRVERPRPRSEHSQLSAEIGGCALAWIKCNARYCRSASSANLKSRWRSSHARGEAPNVPQSGVAGQMEKLFRGQAAFDPGLPVSWRISD